MHSLKRDVSRRAHRGAGFTIPEVLAVVAIIIILLSILLPSLRGGKEAAWRAQCASNQHQIRQAMQGNKMTDGQEGLPRAGAWAGYVRSKRGGMGEIMLCPKGLAFPDEFGWDEESGLSEVYSVQVHGSRTTFSSLEDIKAGKLAADPQLNRVWQGSYQGDFGESPQTWLEDAWGNKFTNDEMGVGYNNDAGFVVQFGENGKATIYSLDAPGDVGIGSNHWVCIGEGGDQWQGEIVMQLTGGAYANIVDPPVEVNGGVAAYGMNSLVEPKKNRGDQVLLMDYRRTIVRMGPAGNFLDDFDKKFAPRHYNKANVMRVDGSIGLMTRGELRADDDIWLPERRP